MTTTAVTQTGPLFRLEWTLDTTEDVQITRSIADVDTILGVIESDIGTFVDTIDEVDSGTEIVWTLIGQATSDAVEITHTVADLGIPPLDDDRRFHAVLLVAARLYKRKDSPLGVAGGGELGPIMLKFKDPDVEMLLVGLRRSNSDLSTQTWPTVTELRAHVKAGTPVTDAELSQSLDAAVLIVTRRCKGAGIA